MEKINEVLFISTVWPEPNSSAAGERMMQLINIFQSPGGDITYASTAADSKFMADLSAHDIERVSIEVNSSSFDNFIDNLQPSVVIFDRFLAEEQFGWRVAEQCPEALRILDTEDLHCLRRARGKAVEAGRPFKETDLLTEEDAKREIASIFRCDLSLIISEYEMNLLTYFFGIEKKLLFYLPFLEEKLTEEVAKSLPSFSERRHFVTIGNFRHAPNMDAVQYLADRIWPLIKEKLPDAKLYIYGAYPSAQAEAYHQPENELYIKGRVDSADDIMKKARVCLAPLRFGAGLKGKLLKAMKCATPSITTAVGAEGIAGEMPWPGKIAERPEELASAAVELYSNQALWQQSQQRGRAIINSRFAKNMLIPNLLEKISRIQNGMKEHRTSNFMGSMLMHHTTASSKFMARWIEEKNRPN